MKIIFEHTGPIFLRIHLSVFHLEKYSADQFDSFWRSESFTFAQDSSWKQRKLKYTHTRNKKVCNKRKNVDFSISCKKLQLFVTILFFYILVYIPKMFGIQFYPSWEVVLTIYFLRLLRVYVVGLLSLRVDHSFLIQHRQYILYLFFSVYDAKKWATIITKPKLSLFEETLALIHVREE